MLEVLDTLGTGERSNEGARRIGFVWYVMYTATSKLKNLQYFQLESRTPLGPSTRSPGRELAGMVHALIAGEPNPVKLAAWRVGGRRQAGRPQAHIDLANKSCRKVEK